MKNQKNNQLAWNIIDLIEALAEFIMEHYITDEDVFDDFIEDINTEDLYTE